ncbi:hypothetical protein FJT64_021485 [Amphibalanus amphitrite]|uniref:Uncharacterized protein n=1 Tax=Amphibalanus amphitrite TaxID=1232801 RepID=A0A6A4WI77_AMPAM|nr:hypothetical protein FJT64_021485 [Amphibalanus amphitrite]
MVHSRPSSKMATPPHEEITLDRTDVWEVISSVLQKWGNSLPDKKPCPLRRQRKRFTKEGCGPGPCRLPCCRPMLTVLREDVNSEQRREVIGQVRELLIRFELRTRGQARLALSCRDDMRNALLLLLHQLILSCQRGERLTYMAPGGVWKDLRAPPPTGDITQDITDTAVTSERDGATAARKTAR